MPRDTWILRRQRPWTRNAAGERVELPAEWFLYVLDRAGDYAPASAAHNVSRVALLESVQS